MQNSLQAGSGILKGMINAFVVLGVLVSKGQHGGTWGTY